MNDTRSFAGIRRMTSTLCLALSLTSCGILTNTDEGRDLKRLPPCTAVGSEFETLPFDEWARTYHDTVGKIIEAHLNDLRDASAKELQCSAEDYASLSKPTDELRTLAETLPPWKEQKQLDALSEAELGPVLLEYLRIFECSLNERRQSLPVILVQEGAVSGSLLNGGTADDTERSPYNDEMKRQTQSIDHQLSIARVTLERTLLIVGGEDRLRPLSLDIECLKRTSLDIRNALGLVSQATACLPRVRDARGSLRDLPVTGLPPE